MTKQECLAIEGLSKQQAATIKRWFWAAEKNKSECKLSACTTAEEVLEMVNASFRSNYTQAVSGVKVEYMTIEELEKLMERIPELIQKKKEMRRQEIENQIKELQAKLEEVK